MKAIIKTNEGKLYEFDGYLTLHDARYISGEKILEVNGGTDSTMKSSDSDEEMDFKGYQRIFYATEIDCIHITY